MIAAGADLPTQLLRLRFRFDRDDAIESEPARRVFGLFLQDWLVHGQAGACVVVCLADYARALGGEYPYQRRTISQAFTRLVLTGWLVEGEISYEPGKRHGPRRSFALGPRANAERRPRMGALDGTHS
jgi:hypothetical protein